MIVDSFHHDSHPVITGRRRESEPLPIISLHPALRLSPPSLAICVTSSPPQILFINTWVVVGVKYWGVAEQTVPRFLFKEELPAFVAYIMDDNRNNVKFFIYKNLDISGLRILFNI